MDNNKKPSEPSEAERWAKMENEIQKLKRSRSILCVSLFLQSILIFQINLRIGRIFDMLLSITNTLRTVIDTLGTVTDFNGAILRILEMIENFLF